MMAKIVRFNFSSVFSQSQYSIRKLTHRDKAETLELVQREFYKSEPSEVAFYKLFPEQEKNSSAYWHRLQRLFADQIFQRGLSFGCFHKENSNKMVGAIMAKDYGFIPANDPSPQEGTFLYAVLRLKEKLYRQVLPEYSRILNERKVPKIDMWLAAIDPAHRKKGLLQRLMTACEEQGAKRSYEYAVSWATNLATAACHRKLNYTKVAEVNVQEFEDKGVRYFQGVEFEQRFQSLWMKALPQPSSK